MPYADGVYTPASGSLNATAGQTIQSATWNSIHGDMTTALTTLGAASIPVLASFQPPKFSYYNILCNASTSTPGIVNFSAAAGDVGIFNIPASTGGQGEYRFESIRISNAPVAWAGSSTISLYTGAGATGSNLIAGGVAQLTSTVINTSGNYKEISASLNLSSLYASSTLYLHIAASVTNAGTALVTGRFEPYY